MSSHLFSNGFHALNARVTVDFVDVSQFYAWNAVMLADSFHRGIDIIGEFTVENEIYLDVRIMFLESVEQAGHCGAEGIKFLVCPVGILVFANGRVCPTVVGGTEYENNVGTAEIFQSVDKRAVGIILASVASETDG